MKSMHSNEMLIDLDSWMWKVDLVASIPNL